MVPRLALLEKDQELVKGCVVVHVRSMIDFDTVDKKGRSICIGLAEKG